MLARNLMLLLVLFSLISPIALQAEDIHSIENLQLTTDPTKPKQGSPVDSLKLEFDITSSDGLDGSRYKLFINDIEQSLNGAIFEFNNEETNEQEGTETASAVIRTSNQVFNKVSNDLKLEYLVSADSEQARTDASLSGIAASPAENIDDNGNSIVNSIINIDIEDSLETDQASSTERFIRITARHDKRIVPAVTFENFNEITNIIIKNLKVKRIQNKFKTNAKKEFSFELESESIDLADNVIQTVFKTNNFQILEKQKLEFSINLKAFAAGTGVDLGGNVEGFDLETIKFSALAASISSASLSGDLNFNNTGTAGKKLSLESDQVNLIINYESTDSGLILNQISDIKFFQKKKGGGKKKPKIVAAKNIKVKVDNPSTATADASTITIPIKVNFNTKRQKLEKKGFLNTEQEKSIRIPLKITAKDSNGVDVLLEGEASATSNMSFNIPSE